MSTLPVDEPECLGVQDHRAVELVVAGRQRDVGTLTVARVLPAAERRRIGPFVFLDHMGPVVLAPGVGFDIRPHPHIGLSTVSYLFAGENTHRDSLGNVQVNRPGDVNFMTAGRGIVHSERADAAFRAAGGGMHGVQIWLALPEADEECDPSFAHHPEATLPAIAPAAGVRGRVLIGAAFGARSPIRHPGDPLLVDLALDAGARLDLPAGDDERAVFVIEGELRVGDEAVTADRLAVLRDGCAAALVATAATRALVLGGPAFPPRLIEWNFVASSRAKIERAREAWKARQLLAESTLRAEPAAGGETASRLVTHTGSAPSVRPVEFPAIPTDAVEFIPWPEPRR